MDVFSFFGRLGENSSTIWWLREQRLLKRAKFCSDCSIWCSQIRTPERIDGYTFRCSHCRKNTSIREESFSGSHLPLRILMAVIYFFLKDLPNKTIMEMLPGQISEKTLVDWLNFCRDVMSWGMLQRPLRLGGPGEVVEIDESKLGKKRKYNRGAQRNEGGPLIFGMIEQNRGKVIVEIAQDRSRGTLEPKIITNALPGSTNHSDEWASYANLGALGYNHRTVNHSQNFVAAVGTHTNKIEGFWGNAKQYFKRMRGVNRNSLPGHLDEVMSRW